MEPGYRPGEYLKQMRHRLGITTREVEELTRKVAVESGSEEFYISNAWLTQLENKSSVPSVHKLFTLSVIYRDELHRTPGHFWCHSR
jgi:transcriptional regulator with XRE-family HTH domain